MLIEKRSFYLFDENLREVNAYFKIRRVFVLFKEITGEVNAIFPKNKYYV